ncbi:molybdate ABC transporter substrate-binding protein [Paracoccus methylarcula]|uniref:Molybdate ABC transporter substrate-binding protein n=2 Tax=Paracoccus methylarcula TaxID=72022 RepID=A0A3R7SDQ9_9RHOB|nr:molybdate ABC transporter substrate-binding protein [Paracoccus methylarcula]
MLLPVTLLAATPAPAEEIVVFAAASLKSALDEMAAGFRADTGNDVAISYAGSGKLAQQILAGAPADLFISANLQWMDEIENAGLVAREGRRDILGNRLVLIANDSEQPRVEIGPGTDLPALLDGGRLAMGLVQSVPAGQYGKAALEHLGLWDAVAENVAQTDNVRAALALVSNGEAPFGIVYASDALAGDNVTVAGEFPESSHPPIIYPAALLTHTGDQADRAFLDALSGEAAAAIFARHGFTVLN